MTWSSMRLVSRMCFWRVLIMLMRPSLVFRSVLLMGKGFQLVMPKLNFLYKLWPDQLHMGAFYLHLLDFTFICQFHSRMATLVESLDVLKFCWSNCLQIISQSFQNILMWCMTENMSLLLLLSLLRYCEMTK